MSTSPIHQMLLGSAALTCRTRLRPARAPPWRAPNSENDVAAVVVDHEIHGAKVEWQGVETNVEQQMMRGEVDRARRRAMTRQRSFVAIF